LLTFIEGNRGHPRGADQDSLGSQAGQVRLCRFVFSECASHYRRGLFLITQQFSLRVPDLQAVPVDYVMIWTQGLGGLKRQFEGLKRLHGMAAVSCDAKRSVQAMTLSGFSEKFAWHPAFLSVGPSDEGVAEPKNPMVGNFAVCCERTASGHLPPRRERPGIFVA
jgi:hypothetical protein